MIEVVAPGVLTLIEDLGRPGLAAVGVGRSGAADPRALRQVNRLVGNASGAACLEVLLGGLELRFLRTAAVALAGASVPAWVDDEDGSTAVAMRTAFRVPAGACLRLGAAGRGLRTYVAVRGGIDVPAVLGSRSTDVLSGLGPSPLAAGDLLAVGSQIDGLPEVASAIGPDGFEPDGFDRDGFDRDRFEHGGSGFLGAGPAGRGPLGPGPVAPEPVVLPVVPGPRADWFAPSAWHTLTTAEFAVLPASNRVALRLDGPALARTVLDELPSEGLVVGAVQVPPDGRPVLFLADHPVTGGYPVLAVVRSSALGDAAQLRPGDTVRFEPARGSRRHAG